MRAYQGIFARFTLSSSASSASDFFFRPRPRNPILLLNLSCFFWCTVGVPSFSEEKNSAFTFCLFPKSRRKSRKSNTRRNFNAKICLFRRERHKKQKEEKKRDKTRLFSFLFSFFISLLGKKEYTTHTQQQHKHARFREVKRERDDCKWFFFDVVVVVFIITRSNFGTTARRRRFSSKEESTFTTTTTTTTTTSSSSSSSSSKSLSSSSAKENFCF